MRDVTLRHATFEMNDGLIDASLGVGLVKKRLPRRGQGKRGGHRAILAFKSKERSVFLFGFSKNEQSDLTLGGKEMYKRLAKVYLDATSEDLEEMCVAGKLLEVME